MHALPILNSDPWHGLQHVSAADFLNHRNVLSIPITAHKIRKPILHSLTRWNMSPCWLRQRNLCTVGWKNIHVILKKCYLHCTFLNYRFLLSMYWKLVYISFKHNVCLRTMCHQDWKPNKNLSCISWPKTYNIGCGSLGAPTCQSHKNIASCYVNCDHVWIVKKLVCNRYINTDTLISAIHDFSHGWMRPIFSIIMASLPQLLFLWRASYIFKVSIKKSFFKFEMLYIRKPRIQFLVAASCAHVYAAADGHAFIHTHVAADLCMFIHTHVCLY